MHSLQTIISLEEKAKREREEDRIVGYELFQGGMSHDAADYRFPVGFCVYETKVDGQSFSEAFSKSIDAVVEKFGGKALTYEEED